MEADKDISQVSSTKEYKKENASTPTLSSDKSVTTNANVSLGMQQTVVLNTTAAVAKSPLNTENSLSDVSKTEAEEVKINPVDPANMDIGDGNLEDADVKPNIFDEAENGDQTGDKDPNDYQGDIDGDEYEDPMARNNNKEAVGKLPQEPNVLPEINLEDDVPHKKYEAVEFEEDPDSNFFTYLCALMFLCVILYILHANRHKIMALFLEGRRGRRSSRDRTRSGSKAAYSKLDCNLEEAIMSKKSLSGKSMDIIY